MAGRGDRLRRPAGERRRSRASVERGGAPCRRRDRRGGRGRAIDCRTHGERDGQATDVVGPARGVGSAVEHRRQPRRRDHVAAHIRRGAAGVSAAARRRREHDETPEHRDRDRGRLRTRDAARPRGDRARQGRGHREGAKLARGAIVGIAAGVFFFTALVFALVGCAWLLYFYLPGNDFTYFWGFFAMAVILVCARRDRRPDRRRAVKGRPADPRHGNRRGAQDPRDSEPGAWRRAPDPRPPRRRPSRRRRRRTRR